MTPAPYHVVMQAYGQEGILQECLFVMFSFAKKHTVEEQQMIVFHVYTDRPEWFKQFDDCPLRIIYHELPESKIRQWRGAINFVHRVKIELLRDFAARQEGALLYLDTDVYFTGSILPVMQRISGKELFMHVSEGRLNTESTPMMKKLNRFLEKNNSFLTGDQMSSIPQDTTMWNAGVLGFHSDYAPVLDAVLTLTDHAYQQFPKHIIEQFAFSYLLGKEGPLHHTANRIVHYWILSEIKSVLNSFFAYFKGRTWDELVRYSELIPFEVWVQEKASFFINRSIGGKVRKLRWEPALPNWEELLQQM